MHLVLKQTQKDFLAATEGLSDAQWKFKAGPDRWSEFEGSRDKEIAYLAETKEDLRSHFGDHPLLKTMDAYQWLLLNAAHCKRHTAQILEVKADPNYPKS